MIEEIADLPPGIIGVRAGGTLTRHDYDTVLAPLIDEATRDHTRIRCLIEIGPTFTGMTPGAVWEDLRFGLRSLWAFDGFAVVSDIGWMRESSRIAAFLMACPVKGFTVAERAAALDWLGTLPAGAGVTHRLITESGVVVIEVEGPLRIQDFEALARTIARGCRHTSLCTGSSCTPAPFPGGKTSVAWCATSGSSTITTAGSPGWHSLSTAPSR